MRSVRFHPVPAMSVMVVRQSMVVWSVMSVMVPHVVTDMESFPFADGFWSAVHLD